MALVGEMQYLTIGGNTYSLPSGGGGTVTSVGVSNATNGGLTVSGSPITSSGTVTIGHTNTLPAVQNTLAIYPIKIDKNGHISEYGNAVSIPTKVSDLTNDSGFVTTDEKVKTEGITTGTNYYVVVGPNNTSSATTKNIDATDLVYSRSSSIGAILRVGNGGSKGFLRLGSPTANSYTTLGTNATTTRAITLPDKDGTVALTSDIPTVPTNVSAFTNDAGYITGYTETDPIFTASAAHGISSSDITNWNGKQAALVSGTNIKTVNNESLLGSGNITVSTVAAQIIRW